MGKGRYQFIIFKCLLFSVVLGTLLFVVSKALSAEPDKESVLHSLQENREHIEQINEQLSNSLNEKVFIQKVNQLLTLYEKSAKLWEQAGDMPQAYDTLQQAYALEMTAHSFGQKYSAISIQLALFKSRLFFVNGSGLISVLSSEKISKHEKYALVDLLESVVENDTIFKANIFQQPQVLSQQVSTKLEEISKEINENTAKLPQKNEKGYEGAVKRILEMYLQQSEVLADANYTVEAFRTLLDVFEMEVQELGEGMGETSATPYAVGRFTDALLGDGDKLLAVLHSKDIPLTEKKNLLFNLKDTIRLEHKYREKGKFAF
jgi:hypothetical protein